VVSPGEGNQVLSWFRRRGAPKVGPDYRHIDSREKAEDLCRRGELTKLLLLPVEFGGEDIPPNVVYVPVVAAHVKTRIDLNTIKPLAQKGQVRRYEARPEYEGKSVIPSLIRISATEPGRFEGTVAIWGKAVQQNAKPVSQQAADRLEFTPAATAVEALAPEDFVRAFIADYASWNGFAYRLSEQRGGMAAAESAYDALMEKYCPPGHPHQPLAFGSESNHEPTQETVVHVELVADGCVVKTRQARVRGNTTLNNDYEYHLRRVDPRWFLTSILYVTRDGKYEGL
jgi:hypothetical protein